MGTWKVARLAVLLVLLGGLAWTLWYRSVPGRLSGTPAAIGTAFKTEHAWAVEQIASDIEEMAAFAAGRPPKPIMTSAALVPWEPDAFLAVAHASLGAPAPLAGEPGVPQQYEKLTAMTMPTLVESSNTVSWALSANMRDPRAHESAALVLGAFAMRDAADVFTDVRWSLNRMTAHLAMARALRNGSELSPDGAIADVILSALSNRQATAMTQLGRLGTGTPPEPLNAWIRALGLRIFQDWRAMPDPASATRLEKLEYFRARRATVRRRRAAEELQRVGEEVALDFARIAQDSHVGVEDGSLFIDGALENELAEAAETYQVVNGRPMPPEVAKGLNHRATRLIDTTPAVLPWGAWAEFFQRHIAMNIGMVDSRYRHMLGSPDRADEAGATLDRQLGGLTSFPLGTHRRTKGRAGTEADMAQVARVVQLAARAPELITYRSWIFFEAGSRAEPVPQAMPKAKDWFAPPSAPVPFDAGARHSEGLRAKSVDELISAAPNDRTLLAFAARGSADSPSVVRARNLLAQRHHYDIAAIDVALNLAKTDEERVVLQRQSCALSSLDCTTLARTLVLLGDEVNAAAEYERAFADPMMDAIGLSQEAGWLVNYYHSRKRPDEAVALAERAASSGALAGTDTRGYLRERLRQLDEAERDFLIGAVQYKSPARLLGFYFRRVEIDHNQAYAHKWEKWRAETFPKGLQPEPTAMTGAPAAGVFVYKDSERSRKVGIRAGDIIVGLEGWRVENLEQYTAINVFTNNPHMKITLWRGTLIKIETDMPGRLFGMDIQTHPLKGWIRD